MAFSAKEIKRAQRIANEIVGKKEKEYEKKHEHDGDMSHYKQLCELAILGILRTDKNYVDKMELSPEEARQAEESISTLPAEMQIEEGAKLLAVTEIFAQGGDTNAKNTLDVIGMMADDTMDNLRRMAGADVPERERTDQEKYLILSFKIRMPQTRHYIMEALFKNDSKLNQFMTMMRKGILPPDNLVEHAQKCVQEMVERDRKALKELDAVYGENGKRHKKYKSFLGAEERKTK